MSLNPPTGTGPEMEHYPGDSGRRREAAESNCHLKIPFEGKLVKLSKRDRLPVLESTARNKLWEQQVGEGATFHLPSTKASFQHLETCAQCVGVRELGP